MKIALRVVKLRYICICSYTITKMNHTAYYPIQLSQASLPTPYNNECG
jgi:hypothetical protein